MWELKRRDGETPGHRIRPDSQLAAESNDDSDLTPYSYCIASRLITSGRLSVSVNVSAHVGIPAHFSYLCICVEGCFSVPRLHVIQNLVIQCYWKWEERANPSYGIDVKQDKVDPYATEAAFDSLSITPLRGRLG